MKILRMSHYIHINYVTEFQKNRSGLGRSVWDISRNSAKYNQEFLFSFNNREEKVIEGVNIIENNILEAMWKLNIKTLKLFCKTLIKIFRIKHKNILKKISYLQKSLYLNYLQNIIIKYDPDVIHIHGLTITTIPMVIASIESKVPFVVTLHGLNDNIFKDDFEKKLEFEMIKYLNDNKIYITVVGSGIKKTIQNKTEINYPELIQTVNDGIDPKVFNLKLKNDDVRKEFNIKESDQVILYVGSLTENKNQMLLIESLLLFEPNELNKIKVFIIGEGPLYSYYKSKIDEYNLNDVVKLVGQVDVDVLSKYYTIANITVLLSTTEGFGRPILESYLFGVPVLTFRDLAAVEDLFLEGGLFFIENRSIEAVYEKIRYALQMKVNKNLILEFGNNKTWDKVAIEYSKIYKLLNDK